MDPTVLEAAREQIHSCMKCGNCQAVCPLFSETRDEGAAARGKIHLAADVLEGRLQPTPALAEKFGLCLTCKACEASCPCGVKVVDIILAARASMAETVGLPSVKRVIFHGLKMRRLFNAGMKLAPTFQGFALKKVKVPSGEEGFRSARLPIGLDARRVIHELAPTTLRDGYEEWNAAYGEAKRTVAFFTGCVNNLIYVDGGKAIVEVLRANGCNVVIPKAQHCCGAPVFVSGDRKTGAEMARHNLDVFAAAEARYGLDAVFFACGTCVSSFAEFYPHLLGLDAAYAAKAERLRQKAIDVNALLLEVGAHQRPMGTVKRKVTYHDSCHLARSVSVTEQPRQLMRAIPGVELVELKDAARCCGGAGSFSLTHYALSSQVTARKAANIQRTGADTAATGCPGCRMTIEDGLAQAGGAQRTVHPAMLLYEAYVAGGLLPGKV